MANVTINLQNPYHPTQANCVAVVDEESQLPLPDGTTKRAGDVVPGDVILHGRCGYVAVA